MTFSSDKFHEDSLGLDPIEDNPDTTPHEAIDGINAASAARTRDSLAKADGLELRADRLLSDESEIPRELRDFVSKILRSHGSTLNEGDLAENFAEEFDRLPSQEEMDKISDLYDEGDALEVVAEPYDTLTDGEVPEDLGKDED